MTDLIKFLRTSTSSAYNKTAADRIEALENSLAWYKMMDAMSSDHVVELTDKLEAAEAKLTNAVEALRFYSPQTVGGVTFLGGDDAGKRAAAALADSENYGVKAAAKKHKLAFQTIYRWRKEMLMKPAKETSNV